MPEETTADTETRDTRPEDTQSEDAEPAPPVDDVPPDLTVEDAEPDAPVEHGETDPVNPPDMELDADDRESRGGGLCLGAASRATLTPPEFGHSLSKCLGAGSPASSKCLATDPTGEGLSRECSGCLVEYAECHCDACADVCPRHSDEPRFEMFCIPDLRNCLERYRSRHSVRGGLHSAPVGYASKRGAYWRVLVSLATSVLVLACSGKTPDDGDPNDDGGPSDAADVAVDAVADVRGDISPADTANDLSSDSEDTGRDGTAASDGADDDPLPTDATEDSTQDADASVDPWRSQLFPLDWEPNLSIVDSVPGLADYSYAGYAAGLRAEGAGPGAIAFDVADYGLVVTVDGSVDPDADNTDAIQAAIDAASVSGGIVQLPAGLIRVDGALQVSADHVVVRGSGVAETRLIFTAYEGMSFRAGLTVGTAPRLGDALPLVADAADGSFEVRLAPDADIEIGEELALGLEITAAFVERHGMTGVWGPFNGSWQPFAWRTVVNTRVELLDDVPSALVLTLDVPLREPHRVEDRAAVRVVSGQVRECGVEDLSISNAVDWDAAWLNDQVHAIAFRGVRDGWVRNVRSFVSPLGNAPESLYPPHLQSSGVLVFQSRHVTLRDVHLANSQHRGGGGNGYLFEIRQSNEVLTVDSTAENGRHNFIQNWGFGTSGCVWLRIHSDGSAQTFSPDLPVEIPAASEFHHSLATANLVDYSVIDDGWFAENRRDWSSGAGVTAWRNVLWNIRGQGEIRSMQWGVGYVIGTEPSVTVRTSPRATGGLGTEPEDWVEGEGVGEALEPPSLYEAQLARRLALIEE